MTKGIKKANVIELTADQWRARCQAADEAYEREQAQRRQNAKEMGEEYEEDLELTEAEEAIEALTTESRCC